MIWLVLCAALVLGGALVYARVMWPSPLVTGAGPRTVACVGDSITYSLGVLGRRRTWSYPARLAALLGPGWRTVNYGLSDRTLQREADRPYFREKMGRLAWQTDADVVVLMLGSNDCKRKNWDAERFRAQYEAAIRHYQHGEEPRLLVLIPPRIFYPKPGREGYDDALLRDSLRPIVRSLAAKHGVPCLDLYALTEGHPEWFPDRLHPNRPGNAALATAVCAQIEAMVAGQE